LQGTPTPPKHVISPALFDSIDTYIDLLDRGEAIANNVVPETSPVISFSQNAFAQFFQNEVHAEINGFDSKAKRKAARLRRTDKSRLSAEARSLIALFEQFCDVYEDVLGAGYGGQESVLEEFHSRHVHRLLKRIAALAKANKDEELQHRADASLEAFDGAVKAYDWTTSGSG
jgi:plasmid maintenance system killer protein